MQLAANKNQIGCFKFHKPFIHDSCKQGIDGLLEFSRDLEGLGSPLKFSLFFQEQDNVLNPWYYILLSLVFLVISTIIVYSILNSLKRKIFSDFNSIYNISSKRENQPFIFDEFSEIGENLKNLIEEKTKRETDRAVISMAKQLAHDIRSPLEVLKGLKQELMVLPENSRRKFEMCINRTEEIAYNLLKMDKMEQETGQDIIQSQELLSPLENILLEKQLEYSSFPGIEIVTSFNFNSFGLFSEISGGSLKRIISNLINNGIEAFDDKKGLITVKLYPEGNFNVIEVSDTGSGIPEELKQKIFTQGFTSKVKGNGLGLSGAIAEISKCSGKIDFVSSKATGTTFKIILPRTEASPGFVKCIDAYKYEKIIILDDDSTFHEIWKDKLHGQDDKIESFYSIKELYEKYPTAPSSTLLLSDFELADEEHDGIDVILKYGCATDSILTTARGEEADLQERCTKEGIRLLSKIIIPYVQVNFTPTTVILIDDDKLIRLDWKNYFQSKGFPFQSYSSIASFLENCEVYKRDTLIYVDSNLGDGLLGEVESEKIFLLGFQNIFLATGYQKSDIKKPAWIKEVHSKNPRSI